MTAQQQRDYLFMRFNPRGLHFERWRCDRGCGKWFHAARDTMTMQFKGFYAIDRAAAGRAEGGGDRRMGVVLRPGRSSGHDRQTLPPAAGAGARPPRRPLEATELPFDGVALSGYAGDTLASAVMANGRRLFGRSFKYHRPRGVVGLGSEEMNALVGVGVAGRHEPNRARHPGRTVTKASWR